METARIAFAPSRPLFSRAVEFDHLRVDGALVGGVQVGERVGDLAVYVLHRFQNTFAEITLLSPSRNSTASCSPVEAPLGTMARPDLPVANRTSASTVGLPRESSIFAGLNFAEICVHGMFRDFRWMSQLKKPAGEIADTGIGLAR